MLFSDYFELGDVGEEDWFDPVLSLDTELFIDPFLLFDNEQGDFVGSHADVIAFFDAVFQVIAQSGGDRTTSSWRRAEQLLSFPEVEELCLGYTSLGTGGVGSGTDTARRIASALWTAVSYGTVHLRHFEEVQIFEEGIGPDRISDATAGILRRRIASYTASVADRLGIAVAEVRYQRSTFSLEQQRWTGGTYLLPINPYNNKPIFLVPRRYLRPLPTINPQDYWKYCYDFEPGLVRQLFGDEITRNVRKEFIVELARTHPDTRQRYVDFTERGGSDPYDFPNDPKGLLSWYSATASWVAQNPLALNFSNGDEFTQFVSSMVGEFRRYVEDNRGWSLLWNDNETPRKEDASQRLFLGVIKHYCKANNVDVSPETNIGSGPVDFKVSSGYAQRALIEVKLAKNTRFWHGLQKQLPKYLKAEDVREGIFLVIVYSDTDLEKIADIEQRVDELNQQLPYRLVAKIVDARKDPPSASML